MDRKDLNCDLNTAREGCIAIANHILDLVGASGRIITGISDHTQVRSSLKSAYILNLIALEEIGKLFRLWQVSAEAQNLGISIIRINDFRNHHRKASIANSLLSEMLDYFTSELSPLDTDPSDMPPIEIARAFKSYRTWLSSVLSNFSNTRENVMYVDYSTGGWTKEIGVTYEMLFLNRIILGSIAEFTIIAIQENCPFSWTTKALLDIKNNEDSIEAQEFIELMKRGIERKGIKLDY
jgi:AbiV family abortive infection protein